MRIALASVLAASLLVGGGVAASKGLQPGVERWPIKTSEPTTSKPKVVKLQTLLALQDADGVTHNDKRYQDARIPDPIGKYHEGDLIQTTGWLHLVALEGDGDYHVQISADPDDGNDCLIVEVPKDDADFEDDAKLRASSKTIREWFRSKLLKNKEPVSTGSVMKHPVYVTVTGALFFDDSHVGDKPRGKRGMKAATLWELHPVTAITFAPRPAS